MVKQGANCMRIVAPVMLAALAATAAAEEQMPRLQGDVGLGAYHTRSIVRGVADRTSLLPYTDFNYGEYFARVDTFGIKTRRMGQGYLELIARFNQDGFRTDTPTLGGLRERRNSIPLGVGTLQVTPVGGFYLNAFHDVNESRGNMLEAIYGAKFGVGAVTVYPLLGLEYRSAAYVRYYYGVSDEEAAASAYAAYHPSGAGNILAGLIADVRISDEYHLNLYFRRKRLGAAIRHSPLVEKDYQDTAYLAFSYRFR
jgi:outer membrane protein